MIWRISTIDNHKLFQLGACRSVTEFEKLNRVGEGTYGIVCKLSLTWINLSLTENVIPYFR